MFLQQWEGMVSEEVRKPYIILNLLSINLMKFCISVDKMMSLYASIPEPPHSWEVDGEYCSYVTKTLYHHKSNYKVKMYHRHSFHDAGHKSNSLFMHIYTCKYTHMYIERERCYSVLGWTRKSVHPPSKSMIDHLNLRFKPLNMIYTIKKP